MNQDNLRRFNGDKNTKKDILDFCIEYFNARILEEAYKGGSVTSLAQAVNELKNAFEQLEIEYAVPTQQPPQDNPAR
jgi:hypothetical protein